MEASKIIPALSVAGIGLRPVPGIKFICDQGIKEKSFNILCTYIQQLTGLRLSDEEISIVLNAAKFKTLRKRQYLLQEGDVCRYMSFVTNGALKMYSVNERGQEAIVILGTENSWIADRESMGLQTSSIYNIEAIEKTHIVQFTPGQLDALGQAIPAVAEMTRLQNKQLAIATQKRIHAAISMTAEEKYQDLISCYPEYIQRFSQNMLASYLGIKPETLSRVRKR
ncbi:Crp/Fnr family transcriptional regulator [Mucilaginibacter pallidiroseus]|uniref:Crp/Fnr family transcriptional regulator n=1 Tax=Mucilaginibacter pallidiroseus TaxID=2599295 RepID=A0A563TYF2_9SPHI|nr:Crp/Fnr family transcriptional regulator [Mucilaginibacter pallidiroseus]TWR24384.1 Crp/Fnr family transcriptional regulator [Mucilaginibacter pallidiroseus]